MHKKIILLSLTFLSIGCFDPMGINLTDSYGFIGSTNVESTMITSTNPTTNSSLDESNSFIIDSTSSEGSDSDSNTMVVIIDMGSNTSNVLTSTTDSTTDLSTSSTTQLDITIGSSTTLMLTTTGEPITCGDCVLDIDEECDYCSYPQGLKSSCSAECLIVFPPAGLMMPVFVNGPLEGMDDPLYNQEEANLLCQIRYRNLQKFSNEWHTNIIGYSPQLGYIMTKNYNNKGYLLKSIDDITTQNFYYFDYENISFNQNFDQQLTVLCQ